MKESYIAWEQYPDEECYLITHLYVRPEERRQGKGRLSPAARGTARDARRARL
jgi:hypothetical protein